MTIQKPKGGRGKSEKYRNLAVITLLNSRKVNEKGKKVFTPYRVGKVLNISTIRVQQIEKENS